MSLAPAALSDSIADKLAHSPFAGLQAPTEADAALGKQVHPVTARQQQRGCLHGRLLQALAPLYGQRLAIQEELAACKTAVRSPFLNLYRCQCATKCANHRSLSDQGRTEVGCGQRRIHREMRKCMLRPEVYTTVHVQLGVALYSVRSTCAGAGYASNWERC